MPNKKVLLIVASEGYQPIEYGHTRKILENAGVQVEVGSDSTNIATASDSKYSQYATANVDVTLNQIDPNKYDGIFIIGGSGAIDYLNNQTTHKIMQKIAELERPCGAICISPRILVAAGILRGKKATGWNEDNNLEGIFKKYNSYYIEESVVVDGNIVTADGPKAAMSFGKAILALLQKS